MGRACGGARRATMAAQAAMAHVELGRLRYRNLDAPMSMASILEAAAAEGKPVLANFVEWPG